MLCVRIGGECSQFPFERLVENRGPQGVEFGGGFGLEAL